MSTKVYDSSSNSITEILDASEVSFIKQGGEIKIIPKDDASHIEVKEVTTRPDGIKEIHLANGDTIEVLPAGPHTLIRNPETVKAEQEAAAKAKDDAASVELQNKALAEQEKDAGTSPQSAIYAAKVQSEAAATRQKAIEDAAAQKEAEDKLIAEKNAAKPGPISGMQTIANAPA